MAHFTHDSCDVSPDAEIGDGTTIWNWTKVREGARVGSDVTIGQHVYIDRDVTVGDRCKIQNGANVYAGVTLGDDVFVGPAVTFTNDLHPRAVGAWELVPTVVEDGASIGANATIRCGVTLGAGCMVGAGSVVVRDVAPGHVVVGNPAHRIESPLDPEQDPAQEPVMARPLRRRRDEPIRVAVIGVGEMGRNHARVYSAMKGIDLVAVVDPDVDRAREVAELYGCSPLADLDRLPDVDAVSVAAPSALHAEIGTHLLGRGIHCLIEKPLATTREEAERLIDAAAVGGAGLLVGHIERFNPAVRQLHEIVEAEEIVVVNTRRMSAVSSRIADIDVVSDLMVHDLDIVRFLTTGSIIEVTARGIDGPNGADHVTALINFDHGGMASLTASRVTQNRVRSLEVTTRDRFFTVDYPNQELLIYRQGRLGGSDADGGTYVLDVGTERVMIRRLEPLVEELRHFAGVARGDHDPEVDGRSALEAMELVWAIQDQLAASLVTS